MRRILPRYRYVLLGVLALICLSAGGLVLYSRMHASLPRPGETTTIILARHGERDEGLNPPLNKQGLVRAQQLAERLKGSGITAIYAADLIRTLQTAGPLAEQLHLPVERVSMVQLLDPQDLARNLVSAILKRHAGQVVLYVGNDSNLEAIYRYLGGRGRPPVRHEDLCTVVLEKSGKIRFTETTYGRTR